jgi:hypothetical protein
MEIWDQIRNLEIQIKGIKSVDQLMDFVARGN